MLQRVLVHRNGLVALTGLLMALGGASAALADQIDPVDFHLVACSASMREAKEEIRNSTLDSGIKDKLLGAMDDAISQLKVCYKDIYGKDLPYVKPDPDPSDKDYVMLRRALREVDEAKKQLRSAKGVTDDHREAAFAAMDKAKEKLKDGLQALGGK